MEESKIILHYFDLNGKAIIARMLMKYGEIPYEDKIYTEDDFRNKKHLFDFEFLPVLEIDNKQYSQSYAIYYYLCRKIGNLLGKNDEDEQHIMSCVLTMEDINQKLYQIIFSDEQSSEKNKNLNTVLEQVCNGLEALYKKNGSKKYFIGDELSLADFYLVSYFGSYFFNVHKESFALDIKKYMPSLSLAINNLMTDYLFEKLLKEVNIKNTFYIFLIINVK